MATPKYLDTANKLLWIGFLLILAYVPFHALIYVWAGTTIGHIDWFKIVPQLMIAAVTPLAFWLFAKDKKLRLAMVGRRVNWLVLWYIVLHIAIAAWRRPEARALIAGLMINLRIVAMFLLGQILAHHYTDKKDVKLLTKVVLTTGLMTIVFGVLQITVLPSDFLRWFGFGPGTIRPFTKLHDGSNVLRYSSTLRGPNPFGAYIVVLMSALLPLVRSAKKQQARVAIAASLAVLVCTFSRSAWIAAMLAVALYAALQATPAQLKRGLTFGVVGMVVAAAIVVAFRDNNFIENSIFHTDETNVAVTSNDGHIAALQAGLKDVVNQPLGTGPGSAGPASVNLQKSGTRMAENYYVQIAQEVGVVGLVLFVMIYATVLLRAFSMRKYRWPITLFVSGMGLAVASLLLHIWADDTLAIIWWGVAGYVLYLPAKAQLTFPASKDSIARKSIKNSLLKGWDQRLAA